MSDSLINHSLLKCNVVLELWMLKDRQLYILLLYVVMNV